MTEYKPESTAEGVLALVVQVGGLFYAPLVLTVVWGWVLVPMGIAAITYGTAWGLYALRIVLLDRYVARPAPTDASEFWARIAYDILGSSFALYIAWVAVT